MQKIPQISVVIPIHNNVNYVREALSSIQNQTFKNFECLILDTSNDGTETIVDEFCAKDARFIKIECHKANLNKKLSLGLEASKAPIIARMDGDDIALPHRLEAQWHTLQANPDIVVLGALVRYIDKNGKKGKIAHYPPYPKLMELFLWECPLCHPCTMFRKDAALSIGGYDQNLRAEDYDFWLRMSLQGRLDNLQEILLLYRQHNENTVIKNAHLIRFHFMLSQARFILKARYNKTIENIHEINNVNHVLELLPNHEKLPLLSRSISNSAHLIGDEHEDEITKNWLDELSKTNLNKELKKALSIYYVRVSRRYFKKMPIRSLRYFFLSCKYDMQNTINMIKRQIYQYTYK